MAFSYEALRDPVDRESRELWEKHPRVGLLPSPELLTKGSKCGQDVTNTLEDFRQTVHWLKNKEALNTDFYKYYTDGQDLQREEFGALIKLAFGNCVDAVRNTGNLTLDEYVIWCYAGHGRDNSSENQEILSMPKLEKVGFDTAYNDSAKDFAKHLQNKPVKGGELCLHDVGYCGLYGLIAPWIASVKDKSQNSAGEKENKHLIIILDSCYAGMIAQDLEKLNKEEKGPWNQNGCSITIQTACGPDECTHGGYFTPCFFTLNNDENLRERLKKEWEEMEEQEKEYFRGLPLPSPKVVTTRANSGQNSLTMEFSFNNDHKLTLFSDSGFFKFCSFSIFKEDELKKLKERVLNEETARDFMNKNTPNFNILDYKLKTLEDANGAFTGSPMGLFLIEAPGEPEFAVCAHVHFLKEDTSRVGRINLVHCCLSPTNSLIYQEAKDGLTNSQEKKGRYKIAYAVVPKVKTPSKLQADDWEYWKWDEMDPPSSVSFNSQTDDQRSILKDEVNKGAELVKACHDFVERKEPGRWNDHTKWNMTSKDKSYKGLFRQKERSQWMEQYMEEYEKSEK